MLFQQLKCFLSVAEKKSFTKAADMLNLSQSAVSQQIQNLEKNLDVRLIERTSRNLRLTPAGEYLRDEGRLILRRLDEIEERVKDLGANSDFIFRFGHLNTFVGDEIGLALSAFHKTYPELKITVSSGTHEELYNSLNAHEMDIILNDQRRAFSPDYGNLIIGEARYYAEFPNNSAYGERAELDIEEITGESCIIPSINDGGNLIWLSDILSVKSVIATASNLEECRLMAAAGQGYVLTLSLGRIRETDTGLCRIPLCKNGKPLTGRICLFYRIDKGNYYIEEFPKQLKEIIEIKKKCL